MNYFFGFSHWKHEFIKPFLHNLNAQSIIFVNPFFKKNYFNLAIKKGLDSNSSIYIWGKKSFPLVEEFALKYALKVYGVEDGFIRSVGLGSDLTQPYSLVVDSRGIYFDPTSISDLEDILQTTVFDKLLLDRAKNIREYLIEKKLSKYNLYENKKLKIQSDKKVVLVPGQVEDDASIKYGASGMTNLELLKQARQNAKDAYIIYKPHPDVLVGNRVGNIDEKIALKYADSVVTEIGLDSVLEISDEVHTMTSLVGFEALMRDKKVFTYGIPFYAGWGLTNDALREPRRDRTLSLEELVAATLILYPTYINPLSLEICEIEELLRELEEEKKLYNASLAYRVKIKIRNFISRKSQLLLRIITLKS
ncbi:MAG: capsule biosynthesis protein [Epsilonproteobacteria bacterium]|nr:MAG: capsule biosynthesis protein [Campylobacterota bacterium]